MSDTQKDLYKKIYGKAGEDLAVKYLERLGFRIAARNYRTRYGEIDIVAFDGEVLVFAEVKSRRTSAFGEPSEAVDAKKRKKYALTAQAYLLGTGEADRECRFDVVEVKNGAINHIKDAFFI